MNIYDIAKKSGVSIATVSRVLNNSDKVSPKTRERVKAVMKESDYTPNAFARGLGLGSMKMIGILCTDVSDLYYAKAVSLMEKELRERGFDTLLCCSGTDLSDKKKSLRLLMNKNVDAIVLIGSPFREMDDNSHIRDAAEKLPVFIINGDIAMDGVYCVLCDEYRAMYESVEYLVKDGAKNILYLYDTESFSGKRKLSGFENAVKECAVASKSVKIKKDIVSAKEQTLYECEKEKFDAIMTSEDVLAIGALKAILEKNINLRVIGFNDSQLALCSTPALTSVDNKLDELCPITARHITDLLSGKDIPQKTVLPATLSERET
ncbi:MAG: LacI family DNA-binding transcriptional regulator [Clostridia bacterium]|nr:LacI family DNA-binding transcriptional regulator [Clostridia bacterium]